MQDFIEYAKLRPWEIFGGKRPFFVRYAAQIEQLIRDQRLKPVESEILGVKDSKMGFAETAMTYRFDPDLWGGKRFAHLHFRGEVYLLSTEQWKNFTDTIKKDFVTRLENAGTVPLEQVLNLSDAMDSIF